MVSLLLCADQLVIWCNLSARAASLFPSTIDWLTKKSKKQKYNIYWVQFPCRHFVVNCSYQTAWATPMWNVLFSSSRSLLSSKARDKTLPVMSDLGRRLEIQHVRSGTLTSLWSYNVELLEASVGVFSPWLCVLSLNSSSSSSWSCTFIHSSQWNRWWKEEKGGGICPCPTHSLLKPLSHCRHTLRWTTTAFS